MVCCHLHKYRFAAFVIIYILNFTHFSIYSFTLLIRLHLCRLFLLINLKGDSGKKKLAFNFFVHS